MAPTGSGERNIKSNSPPTRSRDTFCDNASATDDICAALTSSSSIVNRKRAAKRIDRNTRSGSSNNVVNGYNGVATTPLRKS